LSIPDRKNLDFYCPVNFSGSLKTDVHLLYLVSVISKKTGRKNLYFVHILEARYGTEEKYRIRIRNSWYGPSDLDQYQNVLDPECTTEYKPSLPVLLSQYKLETHNSETQGKEC
jgi:hypothetical protein